MDKLAADIGEISILSGRIKELLLSLHEASIGDKLDIEKELRERFKSLVNLSIFGLGISVDLVKIDTALGNYNKANQLGPSHGQANRQGAIR